MIKNARPLFIIPLLLCLVLFSFNSSAREATRTDNSIHYRMYNLLQKSDAVSLPQEVIEHLNLINKDNPGK